MSSQLNIALDRDLYSSIAAKNKKEGIQDWHIITIYDQDKKVIHSKKFNSDFSTYSLNVSHYKSGIYYVTIQNPVTTVNFTIPKQ